MFAFDADWLNKNSFRNFPVKENCTLLDISGAVSIPQNLIVDLVLATPAVDERFYIQTISQTGSSMSLVIADSTDTPVADVTVAIPLTVLPYTAALIEPVGGSTVYTGRIVLNTDGISALLLWPAGVTYTFDLASAELEPGCLFPVPIDRVLSAGKLTDPTVLIGDLKFKEGYNIRLERIAADNAIQISAIEGAGLGPLCKDQCTGGTGPTAACIPICTINGVGADVNGNIAINGLNTVLISEDTNQIIIDSLVNMAQLCAVTSGGGGGGAGNPGPPGADGPDGPAGAPGTTLKINIENCGDPCPPVNEAFEVGDDGIILAGCCGIDITKDFCGLIPRINFKLNIKVCNTYDEDEPVTFIAECTVTEPAPGWRFEAVDHLTYCCIEPADCPEGGPDQCSDPACTDAECGCNGDKRCQFTVSAVKKRWIIPAPEFALSGTCGDDATEWVTDIAAATCSTEPPYTIKYSVTKSGLPTVNYTEATHASTNQAVVEVSLEKKADCKYELAVTKATISGSGIGISCGDLSAMTAVITPSGTLQSGESVITDVALTSSGCQYTVTTNCKTLPTLMTCGSFSYTSYTAQGGGATYLTAGDDVAILATLGAGTNPCNLTVYTTTKKFPTISPGGMSPSCGAGTNPSMSAGEAIRVCDGTNDAFRDAGLDTMFDVVCDICDSYVSPGTVVISKRTLTFAGGILYEATVCVSTNYTECPPA